MRELIDQVLLHSGLSEERATRAIASVLAGLRRELGRPEAEALAAELPGEFADVLRQGRYSGDRELATWVARDEQVRVVDALEHAASVCRALAETLPRRTVERVLRALPPATAALFEPPSPERHDRPAHRRGHTLADGRPGGAHPVSEARPREGQAESLAVTDDPHAETKLSSSRGLTQEREHESLADGRPGPQRPLADAHDE